MDIDKWTKFLAAVVPFFQACILPFAIVIILFLFRKTIVNFIDRLLIIMEKGNTIVKGPGFEISLETVKEEAVQYLTVAKTVESSETESETESEGASGGQRVLQERDVREVRTVINEEITPETFPKLRGASLLWVDDLLKENDYRIKTFETLGIQCTISRTTEDALEKVSKHDYNVIISDMSRNRQQRAGFELFAQLQQRKITTPLIFHTPLKTDKREEAKRKGIIYASTAEKLLKAVVEAITVKAV